MRFIFFGDSICFGQYVSPHRTWVSRTSQFLDGVFEGGLSVINTSINGNTTRMALERMPFDVQSHAPDFVYVQFGMNDCNYWATDRSVPRVSPAGFSANLHEIIERAMAFGTRHLFLATNHPTPRTRPFSHIPKTYQQSNEDYNALIRDVAAIWRPRGALTLIDHESTWMDEMKKSEIDLKDFLLPDEIHLSLKGHDLYHRSVAPILENSIRLSLK